LARPRYAQPQACHQPNPPANPVSNYEFTIKLLSFCELGNINPKDFDTDHIVLLEEESLSFPTGHFSDADSLIRGASISVLLAFSASVLVLDKGFEVIGINPDPEATDNVGKLRALIYMVRCAQAHGIADPCWEARGRFARTITVDLDGTPITLDLQALNGERFHIDQLGGYLNWYRIRNAANAVFSTAVGNKREASDGKD
jgi:hypothetical protein